MQDNVNQQKNVESIVNIFGEYGIKIAQAAGQRILDALEAPNIDYFELKEILKQETTISDEQVDKILRNIKDIGEAEHKKGMGKGILIGGVLAGLIAAAFKMNQD